MNLTATGQLIAIGLHLLSLSLWFYAVSLTHGKSLSLLTGAYFAITSIIIGTIVHSRYSFDAQRKEIDKAVENIKKEIPKGT